MDIVVSYYGQARQITGLEREVIDVEAGAAPIDVIRKAVAHHGPALGDLLLTPEGMIRQSVLVPVNGAVADLGGAGSLRPRDEISVYPAMSGG